MRRDRMVCHTHATYPSSPEVPEVFNSHHSNLMNRNFIFFKFAANAD